jgi:hypothetical protein
MGDINTGKIRRDGSKFQINLALPDYKVASSFQAEFLLPAGYTKRSRTAKKANNPMRMRARQTAISGVCPPSFVIPASAAKLPPHR